MKLSKHGFLLANGKGEETDVPFAELLQAQEADLTQAVDEAIGQAAKVKREVRDVKRRSKRLRSVAERGGHKVRRLAKDHRDRLLKELAQSPSSSAAQVGSSLFDHNTSRAEQLLAAIGKGSG